MKMIISNSSSVPIYQQIKNSIIEQIMNDELKEDEAIPSIRVLAQDIKISVMTIKKAYDELEQEPKSTELAKDKVQQEIEEHIIKIVELSKKFDISKEEVSEILDLFYGSEKE